VRGRITEQDLDKAEESFPGIAAMYASLDEKPVTFLQLLWLYEADRLKRDELVPGYVGSHQVAARAAPRWRTVSL
jgi:hypothetical protein